MLAKRMLYVVVAGLAGTLVGGCSSAPDAGHATASLEPVPGPARETVADGDARGRGAAGGAPGEAGKGQVASGPVAVDWLGGTYSKYGKTENNVQQADDDRSITFDARAKTYSYAVGRAPASRGSFVPDATGVRFASGVLSGERLTFATDVSKNCRIARIHGDALARAAGVARCPFAGLPLTTAECPRIGTYTQTSRSGEIDGTGTGSELESTRRVVLESDRFFRIESSTYRTSCSNFNCQSLANSSVDRVGTWALAGAMISGVGLDLADLGAYTFVRANEPCP